MVWEVKITADAWSFAENAGKTDSFGGELQLWRM